MILLDTCVLIWLASDPTEISPSAVTLMRATAGNLFVSAISAFEIGQKAAAGKLTLPRPVNSWFSAMLEHHGLREIPVNGEIAARATLLPPVHRDPFDRILIATAQTVGLKLMTPDLTIAKYPGLDILW